MDAKSKVNFINSVAGGQKIPCPSCNALNEMGDLFCFSCGTKLMKEDISSSVKSCAGQVSGKNLCPSCNTLNESDSLFCISCGTKLIKDNGNESKKVDAEQTDTENRAAAAETPKPAFVPVKRPMAESKSTGAAVKETVNAPRMEKKTVFQFAAAGPVIEDKPISAFAQGLPLWDIVPPQVMVRRKKNK